MAGSLRDDDSRLEEGGVIAELFLAGMIALREVPVVTGCLPRLVPVTGFVRTSA